MNAQIAGPSSFSLELVALVIGMSMILGAADVIRQPGWAWKRAGENKVAYLILVILLPVVGVGLYVFRARAKVVGRAAAGRAASLPFDTFGEEGPKKPHHEDPAATAMPTVGFGSFGEVAAHEDHPLVLTGPGPTGPVEVSSTFFSSGGSSAHSLRGQLTLARPYRPRQRASLDESIDAKPTVPAGWKADPTARHQFRYWDGFHWTENVADAGKQSRDTVSS
jgi:Protein of unknown function (DUF2510)